jgi:peptidyl-prolyl cis-trans isomerase B (cyclophilin B)
MRFVPWNTTLGLLATAGLLISACGSSGTTETDGKGDGEAATDAATDAGDAGKATDKATDMAETANAGQPDPNWPIKPYEDPHAVIELEDGSTIVIELEKELAPKTVENFIRLAEQKFYDGTVFHRVMPEFMAQGGSPDGQGLGGPGWSIDLEVHPNLRHVRGSVAMARTKDPNSAGSQFYICYAAKPALDDQYAVFGKVVAGMENADKLPYGTTNPREALSKGWTHNGDGYPAAMKTVRIVDGRP